MLEGAYPQTVQAVLEKNLQEKDLGKVWTLDSFAKTGLSRAAITACANE